MDAARELLACPACEGELAANWSCRACGARYEAPDGIPNLRLGPNLQLRNDARVDAVRRFYEHTPFPGYPPRDSLTWLRARAERSEFARLLDHAIPGDARILEIGCGTGQMSLCLAHANRVVIGADLTRGSLLLGAVAARRFGLDQVKFIETDLHRPGLRAGSFDVVYSSGVLHHTPDPRVSFARIAQLARPGGMIVLGLYNAFARVPLRLRRLVARLSGYDGSRSIRYYAIGRTNRRGAKRGCAISISIRGSTGILLPRCRAGLTRTASSTCGHTPARPSAMTMMVSLRRPPTDGGPRVGSRRLAGFTRLGRRAVCSLQSAGAVFLERAWLAGVQAAANRWATSKNLLRYAAWSTGA